LRQNLRLEKEGFAVRKKRFTFEYIAASLKQAKLGIPIPEPTRPGAPRNRPIMGRKLPYLPNRHQRRNKLIIPKSGIPALAHEVIHLVASGGSITDEEVWNDPLTTVLPEVK
jgi:hypothetical protein